MSGVVVIDYGMGNLLSVKRGIEACDFNVKIAADPEKIANADRLILPGVGAFKDGMNELQERGQVEAIQKFVLTERPFLGICLGMQMLMSESEEHGIHQGLGLISGKVVDIPRKNTDGVQIRKTPHIGWSALKHSSSRKDWKNTILQDVPENEYFYFVHSFMAVPEDVDNTLAVCEYEGLNITACVQKSNIMGCQFHPEKSGESGLMILNRFLSI